VSTIGTEGVLMTGLYDRGPGDPPEARPEPSLPEHGHEHGADQGPQDVTWERWQKKRTFVRALVGTYSDLTKSLLNQPRVYSSRNLPWKGGPQVYGKHVISPHTAAVAQSIETHIEIYAPGAHGQKHGHMNSAVFYVLKGRGHDVHDGKRFDWKAGDLMLVENGCVHEHFNDDPDNDAHLLVFKAKPLFLFMHLLFQKIVHYPPTTPPPGHEDFKPPADL
jgi:quercetin dioxygenase-like cupin family protein